MTILQAGLAKSGNYWLYRIIRAAQSRAGINRTSVIKDHPIQESARGWNLSVDDQAEIDVLDIDPDGCSYRISSRFREQVVDIERYVERCTHVWTHSHFNNRSREVLPLFDKVVYIVRDVRDVAVSRAHFLFTDYMKKHYPHGWRSEQEFLDDSISRFSRNWVLHVARYLEHANELGMHVVFYENLREDFSSACGALLEYLELPSDEESIRFVKRQTSFSRMKENDNDHVRKGSVGGWAQELSQHHLGQVDQVAGDLLRLLDYPANGCDLASKVRPRIPDPLSVAQVRRIIRNAEPNLVTKVVERVQRAPIIVRNLKARWDRSRSHGE